MTGHQRPAVGVGGGADPNHLGAKIGGLTQPHRTSRSQKAASRSQIARRAARKGHAARKSAALSLEGGTRREIVGGEVVKALVSVVHARTLLITLASGD
jgi:hypothetical protein